MTNLKETLQHWREAHTSPDPSQDWKARKALVAHGPTVLPAMLGWLQDPNPRLVASAVDVLRRLGPKAKQARLPLLHALRCSPIVKDLIAALQAIGPIETSELPFWVDAIKTHPSSQALFIDALWGIHHPQVAQAFVSCLETIDGFGFWSMGKTKKDLALRDKVIQALGTMGDCATIAIPHLQALLQRVREVDKVITLEALLMIGGKDALSPCDEGALPIEAIERCLQSSHETLQQVGLDLLAARLEEDPEQVTRSAKYALSSELAHTRERAQALQAAAKATLARQRQRSPAEALRQELVELELAQRVDRLVTRGRELQGKPLRRKSWEQIAEAMESRQGARLAAILVHATRREKALKALRLARSWKQKRNKTKGGKGGARRALRLEKKHGGWERDWELMDWREPWEDLGADELYENQDYYDERYGPDAKPTAYARPSSPEDWHWPDVWPASPIQNFVETYVQKLHHNEHLQHFATLADQLHPTLIEDLRKQLRPIPTAFFERWEVFLQRYELQHLDDLLAEDQTQQLQANNIYELAAFALLEQVSLAQMVHWQWDWPALRKQLVSALREGLSQDFLKDDRLLIRAFFVFTRLAPAAEQNALLKEAPLFHEHWLPLLLYPAIHTTALPMHKSLQAHYQSYGSRLVTHLLRYNHSDLQRQEVRTNPYLLGHTHTLAPHKATLREDVQAAFSFGAGSLRQMNYPSFQLHCRSTISLLHPNHLRSFLELAETIRTWHAALLETQSIHQLLQTILPDTSAFGALDNEQQETIALALEEHLVAFVLLKAEIFQEQMAQNPFRLRSKHIRRFWKSPPEDLPDWQTLRSMYPLSLLQEGLVHALMEQRSASWGDTKTQQAALKQDWIRLLRMLAMTYDYPIPDPLPSFTDGAYGEESSRALVEHLLQRVNHAPLEMTQALLIPHQQGLPLLLGGHKTRWEHAFRTTLREATGTTRLQTTEEQATVLTCRPISKLAALNRGELGRDCSSSSVPFRAISPHHVYYGIFDGKTQKPGYMTVFEAWAEDEEGQRFPVLCLETINAPIKELEAAQQDLLLLFEAVAKSRGLHPHLVLLTNIGTWNYQNSYTLRASRRFRQGTPVKVLPADPIQWRQYHTLMHEAQYYNAFLRNNEHHSNFRILAPFEPKRDFVQPENHHEAQTISSQTPKTLIATARQDDQIIGFISELPKTLLP